MAHATRPTLPPLHALDLPRGDITHPRMHESYDFDDLSCRTAQLELPNPNQRHPIPPPTASPRTPSPPAACLRPRTTTPPLTSTCPFPARKVRLVPTSFENADAVVLVLPPSAPNAPPPQPLLLVGPALARLRHPQRQLAQGARIHPYRVARGPSEPAFPNRAIPHASLTAS